VTSTPARYYILHRRRGEEKAQYFLETILPGLPIRLYGTDFSLIMAAARLKAVHPLVYADCFAVAVKAGARERRHLEITRLPCSAPAGTAVTSSTASRQQQQTSIQINRDLEFLIWFPSPLLPRKGSSPVFG